MGFGIAHQGLASLGTQLACLRNYSKLNAGVGKEIASKIHALVVGQHVGEPDLDCYPTRDKRILHVDGAFTLNECSGGEVRSAVDYVKDRSVRALFDPH